MSKSRARELAVIREKPRGASRASPAANAESGESVQKLGVCQLGLIDYQDAWSLQGKLAELRHQDKISDLLLLLEHPHTYTLGRRAKPENILLTPRQLKRREIAVYEVDRGGDVTYHGPEQLVGYPILKLIPGRLTYIGYIRDLERALFLAVQDLDVRAELKEGFSGVWVDNDKVCAIGVKVDAYGVTSHGFALNVNNDLSFFDHIVPCGIRDKGVTSLEKVLGHRVPMEQVRAAVARRVAEAFGLEAEVLKCDVAGL